ncbi:MAG: hypothetical protein AAF682_31445 [Planctomycetota bacterium]
MPRSSSLGVRRAVVLLLASLLAAEGVGCGGSAPGEVEAWTVAADFDGEALAPRSRGAWRRLLVAESFGDTLDPWTWGAVTPAIDACTLWERVEVDALGDVAARGTIEGRLWALCALRHVAPGAYATLGAELADSRAPVRFRHGCLVGTGEARECFEREVRADDHLLRAFQSLHGSQDGERLVEWGRGKRGSRLRPGPSREAFEALLDGDRIEQDGPLRRSLEHLLEHEPFCSVAAHTLLWSDTATARFWGAALLRELQPSAYEAVRPRVAGADQLVRCAEHGEVRLDRALARHVD